MQKICGSGALLLALGLTLNVMAPEAKAIPVSKQPKAQAKAKMPAVASAKKTLPAPAVSNKVGHAPAIAMKAPAAQPVNRVAVLNFRGPDVFDIDTDEVWKIKNNSSAPTKGSLMQLPRTLESALTRELGSKFGPMLASEGEVSAAAQKMAPTIGGQPQMGLASALRARYVVSGSIDRIEFDGNTVLPDIYSLTVSVQIVDATTGQTVWNESAKKFTSKIYTKKSAKSVEQNFAEIENSDVSTYFAAKVSQALGR